MLRTISPPFFSVALSVLLVLSAALPAAAYTGTFSDDDGSVHEVAIESIAAAGITKGCSTELPLFCPADSVTRAQMATFLARALDLPASRTDYFSDDDGLVHEPNINAVAAAGITLGCSAANPQLFCPHAAVSRAQMATFLVRSPLGVALSPVDAFDDDDGLIHEPAIDAIAAAGITAGCSASDPRLFCPGASVTRAQMATFLFRALGLDPVPPIPNDPPFYTTPAVAGTGKRVITVTVGESIQAALDNAQPGDRIELAPGTHVASGSIVARRSGTGSEWIEIVSADPANPAVIDLAGTGEFRIGASYVALTSVEIHSGGGNNIHIAPDSETISHIVVRDVTVHDLAWGPGAAIKINRNNAAGAGVERVYIESSDLSEALSNAVVDGVGVRMAVVRDCHIHDNAAGSHGIFFKGGSSDILIERNLISGIRGNAALQLGGNTGAAFWDPLHPDWEGVDQVARNNLIADFDDSAVEIRGVLRGSVHHNTIVTQSGFAIFRLQNGNSSSGGSSDNDQVDILNNLVVATGDAPQFARNDSGPGTFTFSNQAWVGQLRNSGSPTPGIPTFPQPDDVVVAANAAAGVLVDPTSAPLAALGEGLDRYRLVVGAPVIGAGGPSMIVGEDIVGLPRSLTAPTIGAYEAP